MEIKASDIKALRDTTGAGLMDCKKALTECNGDVAAAEKYLREKGLAAMAKRSDRATAEGRIFVKQDGNKVAMVASKTIAIIGIPKTEITLSGDAHTSCDAAVLSESKSMQEV